MEYFALFDLDETIIQCKSMIEAVGYYFDNIKGHKDVCDSKADRFFKKIKEFSDKNYSDRAAINVFFYKQLEHINASFMTECCLQWFHKIGKAKLNSQICIELEKHKKMNAKIIIVSGSFYECVKPIAEYLGVEQYICSYLETENGLYTGNLLHEPIIGEGKYNAVKRLLQLEKINSVGSYAYGDHISDIPMLTLADNPVVIGNDDGLIQFAIRKNWKVIN